jgi:hypothetical protein
MCSQELICWKLERLGGDDRQHIAYVKFSRYPARSTKVLEQAHYFRVSAENGKIADWLAERGGLEPPVSREDLPTETPRLLEIFRMEIRQHPCGELVRLQFGGSSFVDVEFRCHEIPSDELNSWPRSGDRFISSDGH